MPPTAPRYGTGMAPHGTRSPRYPLRRIGSGKLYVNGDRSFWTATLSNNITTSTALTWTEQGVGIEQLVGNEIVVPPVTNSTPLLASWDTAVFEPNLTTYPMTIYPTNDLDVVAGWSIDYASSNPNFVAVLADGDYAGGPQRSAYSTNDGQTWTLFPIFRTTHSAGISR